MDLPSTGVKLLDTSEPPDGRSSQRRRCAALSLIGVIIAASGESRHGTLSRRTRLTVCQTTLPQCVLCAWETSEHLHGEARASS